MRKLLAWFVDPVKQSTLFMYLFLSLMTLKGFMYLGFAHVTGIQFFELILVLVSLGAAMWMMLCPKLVIKIAVFLESGDNEYKKSALKALRLLSGYFLTKALFLAYGNNVVLTTVLFLLGS